jgi:hypothetical protein
LAEDGVHRTQGPWSPTVHALLCHLEAAGFDGAPRFVGIDSQGREVLSFIEGEVLADPNWQFGRPGPSPEWARSEDVLCRAAELLRDVHRAASSFRPEAPVWRYHDWPGMLPGQIVCHGDIGPHNTVYRDGLPVAFIDWDEIRPNDPIIEFGTALWKYVPLGTDAFFAQSAWPERPDLAWRVALFAEAYGLTDRDVVLGAVQQSKERSVESLRYLPRPAEASAAFLRIVADDLDWFAQTAGLLGSALRP